MSAIADFTVAVLDCPTCCRHFIENRVAMMMRRHRVACPHCGAHYAMPAYPAEPADSCAGGPSRPARSRLHPFGLHRRKLQ
jgi:hypothetical protein